MRVLIYAIDFAPKIGGEETYLLLLGQALVHRMRRRTTEAGSEEVRSAKPIAYRCNVTVVTRTASDGFDDSALPFPVVRQPSFRTLWNLLGETDVVHVSGPVLLPLLLALLRRKPVVISHHLYHSVCPNGLLMYEPAKAICSGSFVARRYHECLQCNAVGFGWGKSLLMLLATFPRRWLCKRAGVNVGITEHVSRRVALPRTKTIYHGIPDLPVPPQIFDRRSSVAAIPSFAYVGRLVPEKGLPLLLQAAKRLRDDGYDFRLIFVGDGPERASLETETSFLSLHEQVHFTGFLQGQALMAALAKVAAVVMPSICEETAGIAAIEQMMRGGLVIAADVGGLGEVVDDAGLKFKAGDVNELTACLRQVVESPTQMIEIRRKARQRALRLFAQDRMVDEYYNVYEGLLNQERTNLVS